jgi:ribosomal RNA-processing protein 17
VAAITAALREANDLGDKAEAQEFDEWQGFEEEDVDHEDEYVDEDKFTTVTVESVGVSRDGFTRPGDDGSESEEPAAEESGRGRGRREPASKAKPAKKRSAAKSKKRNFRYESKVERSVTRFKEKRKLLRRKIAGRERKK